MSERASSRYEHSSRRGIRELLVVLAVSLAGIGATLPFSPGDSLPQWDNLVLAAAAGWATWRVARLIRAMTPAARRPWRPLVVSGVLFTSASLLTGAGVGGAFGRSGVGDVLLLLAVAGPTVCCALLAGRRSAARWPVLALDGVLVTVALVVVVDVLVLSPAVRSGSLSPDRVALVVGYGIYPAAALGLAGALCTVTTRAVRRSATAMIVMTGFQGLGSALLAVLVFQPAAVVVGAADVATVLTLIAGVLAVRLAPTDTADTSPAATAPAVTRAGLVIVSGALVGVPATLVAALVLDLPLSSGAIGCSAAVILLLLLRMLVRIRDTGRMSEDLLRSEADFRGLVEASSDGVAIVDDEFRLEFTSPAARTLLGIVPELDPHPVLLDLLHAEDRARVRDELTATVGDVAPALQLRVRPPTGEPRDLEVTHHERPGSGRRVLHLRDVTTRRRRERELERMAFTDHLTRLPNRAMLFQEMAALSVSTGERCLLVLDLDGFKAVNDSVGHEAGDLLLVEVARRLQGLMRADDLVARLGGDEFAVLIAGTQEAAVETAERVVDLLAQPYRVGGWTFSVGASVGLTRVRPGGGQLAFREADGALRTAKQAGKGCWRVHSNDRLRLATATSDVAGALGDGDVQLRYDLIVNGDTGVYAAACATPVWVHRELGTLRAAELWAAAERQGHTGLLQQWLLRRACAEIAAFSDILLLCVDLPAGYVHADELAGEVTAALAEAGMAPARLILTFTEEVLQTSSAALIPALHVVHEAGVQLALTDYGMGSTMWALLARVPLDIVMVDVRDLAQPGDTERALLVLSAIHRSATSFDVRTVATATASREMFTAIHAQGLVAIGGPVLPSDLDAGEVAAVLRRTPVAAVAVS
ncbi:PAS domain S-box-containing protein/diguanylate cyclase (GGDEF) domain-containing protein [Modestobacter sp. DSM 44400]|uniref:diguanylate cyclase domain-containing protein n=1 Tax=Modestobacter sp. DSM 44400 TaxID=1550230 RepID=UPI00089CB950|nr:diguanylate cyclase [Modestobacter sp. DSM 44400]SDY39342.1 PAS domain S-box-containing protein/diguanylate cyclase (GGDEF) domain-containing protein [Modestobacter sp. DSM 44400]